MLKSNEIADRIELKNGDPTDPFCVVPLPDLKKLREGGEVSIDLRLGRWFLVLRQDRTNIFDVISQAVASPEPHVARAIFVPFGKSFVVHPGGFLLGATLEWIRLPSDLGGYITGKSSWGRRGLIIETAASIHPGFTGCLTLEISNLGSVPIAIRPGLTICQISLHKASGDEKIASGTHLGSRRPEIGHIVPDEVARKLAVPV